MRSPTVESRFIASALVISIDSLVPKAAFNYKQLPDFENPLSFRGSQPC
jgi:hypothetical protein